MLGSHLKKIKDSESIKLDSRRKKEIKDFLVNQIALEKSARKNQLSPIFLFVKKFQFAARSFVVSILVITIGLSASIATVNASRDSLPGDTLYSVKKFTELAHYTITLDDKGKTKLQLEFASRRADELKKVVNNDEAPDKKRARTMMALAELKAQIAAINHTATTLNEKQELDAVELALAITTNNNSLEKSVAEVSDKINDNNSNNEELNQNLSEIVTTMGDTSDESIKIITSNQTAEENEETVKEIAKENLNDIYQSYQALTEQIDNLKNQIEKVDVTEQSPEYKSLNEKLTNITNEQEAIGNALSESDNLISENKSSQALLKTVETDEMINSLTNAVEDPETIIMLSKLPITETEGDDEGSTVTEEDASEENTTAATSQPPKTTTGVGTTQPEENTTEKSVDEKDASQMMLSPITKDSEPQIEK